jgi:bifunctional ADP-heptose synthase (sugar kinase/adenylyltransferase)
MNYTSIIEKKIVSEKDLKQEIAIWRFQSKKIVFTNGCFDLIHPGHIHLLNTAMSFGDMLIVG